MKRHPFYFFLLAIGAAIIGIGCEPDEPDLPQDELITGEYAPQSYTLSVPNWMPQPLIPADNPLTEEGVELGRRLFYDPILSSDSTQSFLYTQ